ncbi:polymeric immunoglobulin receptor-like [Anabas testudineus]|uniref:polymeric immunoglobulin receptor-like n=1 Tax=Anabas testudineus TaxID=64144 RepID=UPI000E460E69|nr:polymeric immunoglobulin receptor-like [Anabas testudineus]
MMSSTEMIFLILVFFVEGLLETEALSVTGEMGGKVSIKCSHANAFSNIKYFCKGECRSEDVLISSRDKKDLNSKYVISDEGNKFTVTISHLTKDDSGTYWCGIDRVGLDTYNKVVLTVIKGEMTQCYVCSVHEESFYDGNKKDSDSSDGTIQTNISSPRKLVLISAGLGAVVVSLGMTVLLRFLRQRRRHNHASFGSEAEGTDGKTSSICQRKDASSNHTGNIYSNVTVSSEVHNQPEGPFYTTVSFNKHPECIAVTPLTEAVIYSSITHKSTDEETHYEVLTGQNSADTMRISLKVTVYLLLAVGLSLSVTEIKGGHANKCDNKTVNQTAYIGGSVTINCTFPRTKGSTIKWFCREDEKFHCTELISTQTANYTKRERFSLKYNKHQGVFIVTISALTQADAGRYQCAVKSSDDSNHCRTEMHLSILRERRITTTKSEPPVLLAATAQAPATYEVVPDLSDHININAVVIVGVTCLAVIVMVSAALILCRHKKRQGGSSEQSANTGNNTEGNNGDHNYEEIQMWSQQASSGAALSSIYTMVSPHADQLHYASVTFQKDSVSFSIDGNTPPNQNKNDSSSRAQGGIQPPAAEQTLYSTLTNP